ncbi:helix-turn-helix transcriptional regulator [Microbacteriaceae bacterium VKM Ac-2854]|nr:helix-turn-helix transcriptional regulator [Microbacteriaceae bacterium VKM Ac-2854]
MRDRREIAERIRAARIEAGLSQVELAQLCRYDQSRISQFEHGRILPSEPTLKRILFFARPMPWVAVRRHVDELKAAAAVSGIDELRIMGAVLEYDESRDNEIEFLVSPAPAFAELMRFEDAAERILGYPVRAHTKAVGPTGPMPRQVTRGLS